MRRRCPWASGTPAGLRQLQVRPCQGSWDGGCKDASCLQEQLVCLLPSSGKSHEDDTFSAERLEHVDTTWPKGTTCAPFQSLFYARKCIHTRLRFLFYKPGVSCSSCFGGRKDPFRPFPRPPPSPGQPWSQRGAVAPCLLSFLSVRAHAHRSKQ